MVFPTPLKRQQPFCITTIFWLGTIMCSSLIGIGLSFIVNNIFWCRYYSIDWALMPPLVIAIVSQWSREQQTNNFSNSFNAQSTNKFFGFSTRKFDEKVLMCTLVTKERKIIEEWLVCWSSSWQSLENNGFFFSQQHSIQIKQFAEWKMCFFLLHVEYLITRQINKLIEKMR